MDELVRHFKTAIPKAFESKEYEESVNQLLRENQAQQQLLLEQLSEKARAEGFEIEIIESRRFPAAYDRRKADDPRPV